MTPKPSVEEKRRQEIIEAALTCFAQSGYANSTMEDVAATAGLSKALIYYYFKNKEQLFLAVLDAWLAGFDHGLAMIDCGTSASEKLRHLGQISAEMSQGSTELMHLMFEFWAHAGRQPDLMESFGKALRRYRKWITNVIEEGVTAGEFRQVNPRLAAIGLFAALDGLWAHWMIDQQGFSLSEAVESLIENTLHGLRPFKEDHEEAV